MNLYPEIMNLAETLNAETDLISSARKEELKALSGKIRESLNLSGHADITVICTHNSRRSQLAQLWLKTAALYYGQGSVRTYSGGTEATSFHYRMVNAVQGAGFNVNKLDSGDNPKYYIPLSDDDLSLDIYYSKRYDESYNPRKDFIALMVCTSADEACPVVPGAFARIALPYEDPKKADGTPAEEKVYADKVREIGREMLYVMRLVVNG